MRNYSEPDHLNIGTGVDITIRELGETLRDVIHPKAELVFDSSKPMVCLEKCVTSPNSARSVGKLRLGFERACSPSTIGTWTKAPEISGASRCRSQSIEFASGLRVSSYSASANCYAESRSSDHSHPRSCGGCVRTLTPETCSETIIIYTQANNK